MSSAPRPEPLDPLSRRLLAIVAVLAVLLIAVVVNYWLHGGEDGIDPFNPIAAAASQTQASSGYTADMAVLYSTSAGGPPVSANGKVEFNAETGRARSELSVPTPAGTIDVEAVGSASHVYLRSAAFAGQLPAGAEWIGVEPLIDQTSPGLAGSEGAQDQLQMLRAVADVEALGSEAVNGVSTRRYRGTVSFDRAADFFAQRGEDSLAAEFRHYAELSPDPIPVEVWIAPGGTVQEVRVVSKLAGDNGPEVTMDMRITIDELGVAPEIDLPDPGSVYDATPLLRRQLGLLSA